MVVELPELPAVEVVEPVVPGLDVLVELPDVGVDELVVEPVEPDAGGVDRTGLGGAPPGLEVMTGAVGVLGVEELPEEELALEEPEPAGCVGAEADAVLPEPVLTASQLVRLFKLTADWYSRAPMAVGVFRAAPR